MIPPTYVPGRNTVFIAVGLSLAEARGAERLVLGINAVDYSGYPDCRPDYLKVFQQLANLASWGGSALTDASISIPTDGVKEGRIPTTYVPGRNTVFISVGLSLAEARGAERLVLGVNAVDYSGYPDCRPDYLNAFQTLADLASKAGREGHGAQLWAPLVQWSKVRIVEEALRLGVPIETTWSCYSGGTHPCGVCDSCRIRDAALHEAGRPDLCSSTAA